MSVLLGRTQLDCAMRGAGVLWTLAVGSRRARHRPRLRVAVDDAWLRNGQRTRKLTQHAQGLLHELLLPARLLSAFTNGLAVAGRKHHVEEIFELLFKSLAIRFFGPSR